MMGSVTIMVMVILSEAGVTLLADMVCEDTFWRIDARLASWLERNLYKRYCKVSRLFEGQKNMLSIHVLHCPTAVNIATDARTGVHNGNMILINMVK